MNNTLIPDTDANTIAVRPMSKRNGVTLTLAGALALLSGLLVFVSAPAWFAVGLTLISLGTISLMLGLAKVYEPDTTLLLDEKGLTFYHRRGKVYIEWHNIQRIDMPRVTQGIDTVELPYIAFKCKRLNPMLDNISPRLATGLLTEQRPLLMTAVSQSTESVSLEGYLGTEFTPLVVNGERYKGVLAMFGHRCLLLQAQLGFHFYISIDSLDRAPEDFIKLLRLRISNISSVSGE